MDNLPQNIEWHSVSFDLVLKSLNASSEGLSTTEAGKRVKIAGSNILHRQNKESAFKILLQKAKYQRNHQSTMAKKILEPHSQHLD